MRGQAFALICAAPFALADGRPAAAYAPDGVVVPDPPQPVTEGPRVFGRTTGEKSGLPPMPADKEDDADGEEDVEAFDPHDAPTDAIAVPAPARAGVDDIRYDLQALPPAVAETRRRLIEAARTGDVEALRPLFEAQATPPLVAGFSLVQDPVAHLRNQSGDADGREILAILIELLEAGYVHLGPADGGTYVWPYFAEVPLGALAPEHYVEVYRILTAIDVEELERIGAYTFFRIGIAHDGRIRYFSAGFME
jgi:hypothetical protein